MGHISGDSSRQSINIGQHAPGALKPPVEEQKGRKNGVDISVETGVVRYTKSRSAPQSQETPLNQRKAVPTEKPAASVRQSSSPSEESVNNRREAQLIANQQFMEAATELEFSIQESIQKLGAAGKNDSRLCNELATQIALFEDAITQIDDPAVTSRKVLDMQARFNDQLDRMSTKHKGYFWSSRNTNADFMAQAAQGLGRLAESIIMNPRHDFTEVVLSPEVDRDMRESRTDRKHQRDLEEMNRNLSEGKPLTLPRQTRVDITRQDFVLKNAAGETFDNRELRKSQNEPGVGSDKVAAQIEEQMLSLTEQLPQAQRMSLFSHLNQSEPNHMIETFMDAFTKNLPGWGMPSPTSTERQVVAVQNGDDIEVTYTMQFVPSMAGGELNGIIQYDDQSKVSLIRTATIHKDGQVEYSDIASSMYLNQGERV
ncbi:hypothetical protein [Parendozoicomonas haliclonae]|uniref:Uncharacterized protein n=1 Tax=Parendozoicomonas haliclonae TaxID=1960125 RepID=A0A1X7ANU6_9GAMM|nr:hypothetical protein [Parendozoicomonas haliclonae]SMA49813.1 hypothetical protein EHSB41UT_03602 [Parendozoicomonas haliclonae]